jgi:integrase/recombinase XerD
MKERAVFIHHVFSMAYDNLSQIDEVLSRLDGAYAPNTLKSFYADARAFVDWCLTENYTAFPFTSNTIYADISYMSQTHRYS